MIIYDVNDDKVQYYKWTDSYGRPCFGAKSKAARITGDIADQVMRQVKMLCPDRELGWWNETEKFSRKKLKERANA